MLSCLLFMSDIMKLSSGFIGNGYGGYGKDRRGVLCSYHAHPPEVGQVDALTELGFFLSNTTPRRMLFVGPEGTGKSSLASWFLDELRYRGIIGEYEVFKRGARQRPVRRWIRDAKKRETDMLYGLAISEELLERDVVLGELEGGRSIGVEIFFVEKAEGHFLDEFAGYKVPFYPLPEEEVKTVLADTGHGDICQSEVAIASGNGCYEEVIDAYNWMAKWKSFPWKKLRDVNPLARGIYLPPTSIDNATNTEKKITTTTITVAEIISLAGQIVTDFIYVDAMKDLAAFLDHLWYNDMTLWYVTHPPTHTNTLTQIYPIQPQRLNTVSF